MISKADIAPLITGEAITLAMAASKESRKPIAEGFLYEQTINMMCADPGVGKSTISTQVAVELAAGLPVFGVFKVVRPMKIVYAQTERPLIEWMERVELLSAVYPIVKENLFVTDEFQKLDMLNPSHVTIVIDCLKRDCPDADVIFLDPIYAMISGGLSQDIPASAFTHAMSAIQKATGATLWYNHHTVRAQLNRDGIEVQRHDPSYGSRWLTAHVTGQYQLVTTKEGTTLHVKKDNYGILPSTVILHYDHEIGLCSIPESELPAVERVRNFIKAQGMMKKPFFFNDICDGTKLCTRTVRKIVMHSSISEMVKVVSTNRNKHLYQMRGS